MRRARSVAQPLHRLQPGGLTAPCRMAPASRLAIQPAKPSLSRAVLVPSDYQRRINPEFYQRGHMLMYLPAETAPKRVYHCGNYTDEP
ncbi:unnamed protein product [Coccothraustes coccothraustes]